MAYDNTFTGVDGTLLSAQTSDSSHTHTKRSGAGTLQLDGGYLAAVGADNDSIYTASWVPASADQILTANFVAHTGGNNTMDVALHTQADGDGIWVQYETYSGDPGTCHLFQKLGGVDTTLDSAVPTGFTTFPFNVNIVLEIEANQITWTINGVEVGTGIAVHADLQAAGELGFNKYNQSSDTVGVTLNRVQADVIGGGGGVAPEFTVTPVIAGDPYIGEVLTCNGGTVTGTPTPTKSYQWKVNGTNISGETASTYTIDDADLNVGDDVTCLVTATNTEGTDTDTSNAIEILTTPDPGEFDQLVWNGTEFMGGNKQAWSGSAWV